jgi:undecaprenyl-diphosphatase
VNYEIFSLVNGMAGKFGPLDLLMVVAAKYLIFPLFAAAAVVTGLRARQDGWWPAGAWRIGQVALTLALGFALSAGIRMLGLSQRPFQTHEVHQLLDHAPGVSLPSDHATASFAIAIAVWFFVSARWGPYFTGFAALIAVSRVFVGVHYPADIMAGALVAMVAGLAVWGVTLLWKDAFIKRYAVVEERALESTV